MLTKGQKIYIFISALFAMIIGVITLIPFRTLPFLCTVENVSNITSLELIIKCMVFPFVIIAVSLYTNIKKYQELEDGLDRSRIINVMSYFPMATYMVGLLVFLVHGLLYNPALLGFEVWAVLVALLFIYLFVIIIGFHLFHHVIIKLEKAGTIILDLVAVLSVAAIIVVTWFVNKKLVAEYSLVAGFVGQADVFLFVAYVLTIITFVVLLTRIPRFFKKDIREIKIINAAFDSGFERVVRKEYNRAYNDIMDDFEYYFAKYYGENYDEDLVNAPEEVKEEAPVVEEAAPEVEPTPEVVEEPVVEETPEVVEEPVVEETPEVVEESVVEEEPVVEEVAAPAPAVVEEPVVEEKVEEAPAAPKEYCLNCGAELMVNAEFCAMCGCKKNEVLQPEAPKAEPKPKPAKVFKPSYKEIVAYGSNFPTKEVRVVANAAGTQHKYYLGKKMFLVTQSTNNDYRISFLSKKEEAIELINQYPGVVIKPTSPKGENWFRVTNKGEGDRQFLKGLIQNSLATLEALEEEARLAKEEAKRAKKEAAKAQKAAEKAAKKAAAEQE